MKVLVLTNGLENFKFVYNVASNYGVVGEDCIIQYLGKATFPFIKYDIGISFMYQYRVFKEEIDTHPWINFHPGPLPMYRGRNLCYHAIMNGESEFGATVHYMDENFDTGDIIEVVKFSIYDWDTAQTLHDATMNVCRGLFMDYFPRILSGEQFKGIPNIDGKYYSKQPIQDEIFVPDETKRQIRAITYGEFYPKIVIGNKTFKVVEE